MHHHGADGECHPGPGGIFGCRRCEEDWDEEDEEEEGSRRPNDPRYPRKTLAQHQDDIEKLARLRLYVSARGGLPSEGGIPGPLPDAVFIQLIREAVAEVWRDGGRDTWAELNAEDEEETRRTARWAGRS